MKKILFIIFILLTFSLYGCRKGEISNQQKEIYQLARDVGYRGTFEEWRISIKGDQGVPSKNVQLFISNGYIKWTNDGDTRWYNLVSLYQLIEQNGGIKNVSFQVLDNFIKWQYVGNTEWTTLISLSLLVDPKGTDGKEVTFQESEGYIKWQYVGDTEWTSLIELSTLQESKELNENSAYEKYIENYPNYTGNEQQWLNDLLHGRLGNTEFHTVSFDSDDAEVVNSQIVEDGNKVQKPKDPLKQGYTLEGWYINGNEKWIFGGYNVTEDITLVAHWIANEYLVKFDAGLGVVEPKEEHYTYNTEVVLPKPVLEGNYFMGWYNGDELVEDGIWKIASDVMLRARFIKENYNVYYDLNYDDEKQNEQALFGKSFSPLIPTREGYTFMGWFDNNNTLYIGDDEWRREEDLCLTASWTVNNYIVTLQLNGGYLEGDSSYEEALVEEFVYTNIQEYNKPITKPVDPVKEGYIFDGWYSDVDLTTIYTFGIMPAENITLYAKWISTIN